LPLRVGRHELSAWEIRTGTAPMRRNGAVWPGIVARVCCLWVAIGMLQAETSAKFRASGVLNASALAGVLRGAEALLVPVGRVFEEHRAQT